MKEKYEEEENVVKEKGEKECQKEGNMSRKREIIGNEGTEE